MSHVTFDGANKLIIVDFGVDEIEAFEIYSEWKEWATTSDNAKYLISMRTVGAIQQPVSSQWLLIFFFPMVGRFVHTKETTT
jgi:hypothetical protein